MVGDTMIGGDILTGWRQHVRERTVTPEQAVDAIQPGDNVFGTLLHNADVVIAALLCSAKPVNLTTTVGPDLRWLTAETAADFRVNTYFATSNSRQALNDFLADFTPWWFHCGHKALEDGRPGAVPVDVALVRVSPPNRAGWCCLGNSLWDVQFLARRARTTIAVVSDDVPRTFGDSWLPATAIDWFVEDEAVAVPGPEALAQHLESLKAQGAEPSARAMADHIRSIVRDGDTIQVGTGTATTAIVQAGVFDDMSDLSYFGEMTVPGLIELSERGVISGRGLSRHPGKFVTTMAGGLPHENAVLDDNPRYEFYGYEYMHDPGAIAGNDKLVAINNALCVDLTGQISASHVGRKIWSGTGGQLSYQLGALQSKGGSAVTVLPSTAGGGDVSRIVAEMPAGQVVTVPRDLADLVVTEHGVADLLNKTQRERARALVEIAHPTFRDDLRAAATRLYGA